MENAGCDSPEVKPIENGMLAFENGLSNLHGRLDVLSSRLSPLLAGSLPSSETAKVQRNGDSSISERLSDGNSSLNREIDIINDLITRLEL